MAASLLEQTENKLEDDADINAVFDSIVLSEERISEEGFQEGFKKGSLEGEVEGFHLGYHRGAEVGAEIGYYKGIVDTLLIIGEKGKYDVPDKAISALQKVLELLKQFPTSNTEQVDIIALRDNIRAKFRKACALLKIDGTYPELSKFSF